MASFEQIYVLQEKFENLVIGKSKDWPDKLLRDFTEKEKIAYTKEMILYLHQELSEVIDAVGNYKMHKTKTDNPKTKEIPEEIADCFIFVLNLALTHGITAEQFLDVASKKQEKNFKRQEEGY